MARRQDPTTDDESTHTIPLHGSHIEIRGSVKKSLSMLSSDCRGTVPPAAVTDKHREIVERIDRRKIRDGETHGYIKHDANGEVTDSHVDPELIGNDE
jgi:hypothetical protein